MANSNLHKAKEVKQDEFYTQLTDIEKEMKHYRKEFFGKKIFLNCDDPQESNFWRFFSLNFDFLSLKELTATHYNEGGVSYKLTMKKNGETIRTDLKGDGDFRSDEAIAILKKSDIVVTNPPFSLFGEYIGQLIEYDKKFIVIGAFTAVSKTHTFPFIANNQVWLGISPRSMDFIRPDGSVKNVNACWFTNLEHSKRNEIHEGHLEYSNEKHPKYDNYDAINIDKVVDIPENYFGEMGVPITFLEKINPNQFEIIGTFDASKSFKVTHGFSNLTCISSKGIIKEGLNIKNYPLLKVAKIPKNKTHYIDENGDIYTKPFTRLIIKRIK